MLRALTLALGLIAGTAAAQCGGPSLLDMLTPAQRATLDAGTAAIPHGEGIAFTARRDGATVTLIGSMHLPDPRQDALVERFAPVVQAADLLLVEATRDDLATMEAAALSDPGLMFQTEGPTLPERLDEATWDALAQAMRDRGILPAIGSRMRPWVLMSALATPPCVMEVVAQGGDGLDLMLMDRAAAAGVAMAGLEPWDTILTLLDSLSDAQQIDILRMSLMDAEVTQASLVALMDGYFAGRIGELLALSPLMLDFVPALDRATAEAASALADDILLTRRNRAWIGVIEAAAATQDVVVVAGAAHLPGEAGVLRLLEGNGWTVAPLP